MTNSTQGSTTVAMAEAKVHSRFGPKAAKLLNKVDRKLYQISARQGRSHLLYLVEARLYAWLCRQAWFQSRYQAHEVRQIQRFLDETAILKLTPALNAKQVIQQALLGNYLRWRWWQRFNQTPAVQLTSLFTVQGQENLDIAVQQKKGVIITMTHSYAAHLVQHWLLANRPEPQFLVLNARRVAQSTGLPLTAVNTPFIHARQLQQAKECLQKNGLVSILADGLDGRESIVLPFYECHYPFRIAFAELALHTSAVVLPLSARLERNGRVVLLFHPPMHSGNDEAPRQQRIEQLVKQYAAFLHTEWAAAPGDIPSKYMTKHLLSLAQPNKVLVQLHEKG